MGLGVQVGFYFSFWDTIGLDVWKDGATKGSWRRSVVGMVVPFLVGSSMRVAASHHKLKCPFSIALPITLALRLCYAIKR